MRAHVIAAAFGMAMILAGEAVADGPWKGKIVDAETGQRLSGAVVLAAWWKRSPGVVHERTAFYDATEVVTDDEGRFVIPPVKTATLNPFTHIDGPDLKIFKRGYGQWRFRGEPQLSPSNTLEWERWRAPWGSPARRCGSKGLGWLNRREPRLVRPYMPLMELTYIARFWRTAVSR